MSLFFVFVDGIGIGDKSEENPLAAPDLSSFSYFTGAEGLHSGCNESKKSEKLFKKLDANLGVKGLPQSGTGQASLFTGKNAAIIAGRHFGPFPHSKTKNILKNESLFHSAINMGKKPHFLNAYPDIFFKKASEKNRWSCTTLMVRSSGVRLNRLRDVQKGSALTAEIVQSAWRERLNLEVPKIEPEDASERVIRALEEYDLVLYEYYLTDKAGHEQDMTMAKRVLEVLDRFLMGVLNKLNRNDTFVLTSDHGNLEDLSVKTHTRNPVPLFVKGDTKPFFDAKSILDVTPAILNVLKENSFGS
ncbi:MAG: hypothetical protein R3220_05415 [Balneolaceae bacterium]|nr:hypothetical protein [Balneolaceae bacterium]